MPEYCGPGYSESMDSRVSDRVEGTQKGTQKGGRNRLLTNQTDLRILETWEDQSDQLRAVGFIMC